MAGYSTEQAPIAAQPTVIGEVLGTDKPVKCNWNLVKTSVEKITTLADALIEVSKKDLDAIVDGHAKGGPLTWDTVMAPQIADDTRFYVVENLCTFPAHVSPDKGIRDAATEADKKLSAYSVEVGSRQDLYEVCKAYAETEEAKSLTGEQARCLKHAIRDFKRNGLHLAPDVAQRVKEIKTRESELGIEYQKNLGEEDTKLTFTTEELEGLSADYLDERKAEDDSGKYVCTLKYPCVIPLFEKCKVSETRRKMELAFNSRCKEENAKILEELVCLRHEKALLLGYEKHSDFVVETRMSKTSGAVLKFLAELSEKLTPLSDRDKAECLEYKKKEMAERGEEFDGLLNAWDRNYYCKRVEEAKFEVDHDKIKEYFPIEVVTNGLLGIYQELLGLTFVQDEQMEKDAWHEEVQAFKVTDTASGEDVGWFYMDMHPREGKYGHAACFGLQPACEASFAPGGYLLPIAACVCNFPKPTADRPALLTHDDVETFFHEFGHVMHNLCARAKLVNFAGTRVERDFVEAPSQMLENWVWEPEALKRMSKHYKDGSAIPDSLMNALIKSRVANQGITNKRQVVLATFDQTIHSQEKADTAAVLAEVTKDVSGFIMTPGTNMGASFGHLAGGYDAQYYGYLWSEVYSADMFQSRFKAEGIFNPKSGMSYREEILKPGGSRDALDSVKAFLGRDPKVEPFLQSKGL